MKKLLSQAGLCALALFPSAGHAELQWGRPTESELTAFVAGAAGQILSIEGYVQETTRPFYDITAPEKNEQFAESYTLEELGFEGGYPTFGLAFEDTWRFFTFHADFKYLNPSVSSEAVRDYYLGVDEVKFNGQSYEYMTIPEGASFEADMEGGFLGVRGLITPFSLTAGQGLEITPGLGLGVNAFFSSFTVDAGPAQGVVLYEIPPREYVVGGRGEGWTYMVLPELGIGLDVRIGGGTPDRRSLELILQGYYALLDFSGNTEDFGLSSRNNKVLDLDYEHYEARVLVSVPISRSMDFLAGVSGQFMQADATVLAEDRPASEIEALREKFNKFIRLEMTSVTFLAGLRF